MRTSSSWGSSLAVACALHGCVLIDYERQPGSGHDAGAIVPVDGDGGLDARVLDAAVDGASDGATAREAATSTDGAASGQDASRTDDAAGLADAQDCSSANECGGCTELAAALGDACGACGVGRYSCAGSELLVCANDGTPRSPGNPALIDDLEDGDQYILSDYGLSGAWYLVDDGTGGTLTPPSDAVPLPTDGGAVGSTRSMHVTASGFSSWGAGLGVTLSAYGCGYDASAQTGIEFHLKGTGTVRFSVATKATVPVSEHGTCTSGCYDLFRTTFTLTSSWTLQKAAFAELVQGGWGTPATFDPSEVLYVQFTVLPGASLDVYVDNLSFY